MERNVPGTIGAGYLASAAWVGQEGDGQGYVWPFTFSQIAEEYDRRYGLQDEYLRRIAAQNIANAKTNPKAQTRGWVTPAECFSDDDDANRRSSGGCGATTAARSRTAGLASSWSPTDGCVRTGARFVDPWRGLLAGDTATPPCTCRTSSMPAPTLTTFSRTFGTRGLSHFRLT
jgi:hypothetical protein